MQSAALDIATPDPRSRILTAAQRHFERFGFQRTKLAGIARDAGVAVGSVYNHFTDKQDLFLRVVDRIAARWVEAARNVLSERLPAPERLARLGEASVRFSQENPLHSSILTRDTEMISAPLLERIILEYGRINVALMTEALRDGIDEGTIRAIDPERAAFVLFFAGMSLREQQFFPAAEVLPIYQDIVLNGLVPR